MQLPKRRGEWKRDLPTADEYLTPEAIEGLKNELAGIQAASRQGLTVKINSVLVPGVNDHHIPEIARVAGELGASLMNVIPLIPVAGTAFERGPAPPSGGDAGSRHPGSPVRRVAANTLEGAID